MNRFAAAFWRTLGTVLRDRYARTTMIGAIVLYSFFYPAAYRHQVAGNLPLVVVDEDHSASSRGLLRHIDALRAVRIDAQVPTLEQARERVEAGQAEAVLQIPSGFERDILRGGAGQLVLLGSGAYLGRASTALGGVAEALADYAGETAVRQAAFMGAPAAPPVQLVQRPLFNTREGYGSFVVPGVAELIVHQTLLIGIGVLLGARGTRERRTGLALPELGGMTVAFACIGLLGLLYYAGFTAWIQDYPRGGNLPGLLLVGPLFVLATVLFGLWIGSFFDTRQRAFLYVAATSIPLIFLSGLTWPIAAAPPLLVQLSKLLPTTPGINGIVRLNQMGASLAEVAPEALNLVLLVVLYGAGACWRLRRRDGRPDSM